MGVLDIARRGAAAETPVSTPVRLASTTLAAGSSAPLPGVWNPVRGLVWGAGTDAATQALRAAGMSSTSLTTSAKTILLTDASFAWNSPADVQLTFGEKGLQRIEAVFKQPPALEVAIAGYERQFGKPHTKTIVSQEQVSTIAWRVKQTWATLEITLTETQGTLRAIFEVSR